MDGDKAATPQADVNTPQRPRSSDGSMLADGKELDSAKVSAPEGPRSSDGSMLPDEKEIDSSKVSAEEPKPVIEDEGKVDKSEKDGAPALTETSGQDGNDKSRAWDHTNRKVIVYNIIKYMKPKEVSKLVDSWLSHLQDPTSIKVVKVKKAPLAPWLQISLEDDGMVQPFLDIFNNNRLTNRRGKPFYARRADPRTETPQQDRKNGGRSKRQASGKQDGNPQAKRAKREVQRPKSADEVRDVITPLWRESYEQQLETKWKEMVKHCAMKIVQEVKNKFRTLEKEARKNKHRKPVKMFDWIQQKRAIEVERMLPSPKKTEYRNKTELTFGYRHIMEQSNISGKAGAHSDEVGDQTRQVPAVGFMASGWSGDVSRPHCCQNVPSEVCSIADIVDEFLATSPIPPYDSRQHRGLWRTIAIRTSKRTSECMIVIVHAPPAGGMGAKDDGTDDYSGIFASEKERLIGMLTDDKELGSCGREYPESSISSDPEENSASTASTPVRVTSIFFQEYDGVSTPSPEHPVQHAYGKLSLQENLGKCTFQISPGAFFQVNTECAELLYNTVVEKVRECATKPKETLLFDVCCGTGTIGLTCMKEGVAGRVVGVDISRPAIEDANLNAELNCFEKKEDQLEPTRFIASRAELVLGRELGQAKDSARTIIAVVDPAREGLHSDVIKALRANEKIQRLVYVSCNPTATLVRDAGLVCAPTTKKYKGCPFRPTSAQPVDMFPLTPHCEMVMTFDRIGNEPVSSES